MKITFFGGAGEVGRSCIMVSTKDTNILLDSGVKLGEVEEHPLISNDQIRAVDGIFISHAHLDHVGYLPHIFSSGYKGKVYATKPTLELTNVLLSDYLRISNPKTVTKKGMEELSKHATIVDYRKDIRFRDLNIRFIPAGHILGSALIEVSDGRESIVYTGDINLAKSRLLDGADIKSLKAQTLITESTYGAKQDVFPNEKNVVGGMLKSIKDTIQLGGKVIIPSFAVGRAQEVLFLLDDYINSGVVPKVPVYVDGMINKALRIYRHNVIYCRKELQSKILMSDYDPFKSKNFIPVDKKSMRSKIVSEDESSIIVTTSGMMTGGPVMFYLSKLSKGSSNKLLLVGYQAIGTMGRELQEGARKVLLNGSELKVELDVETYHLSAHADRPQLEMLAGRVKDLENVFIVHGEISKSRDFQSYLSARYKATVPGLKNEYDV
jgi:predicted metal-dependent RNase